MSIGTNPEDSPDLIAETLGLTNAAIERTSAPVTKSADAMIAGMATVKEDRWSKPIRLGSTKSKPPKAVDPTKRDYKEADFSLEVRKWMAANFTKPCAFELKTSPTDSIAFDRLEDHQKAALLKVKRGPFVGLIRNDGVYKARLPFDGYFLNGCAAWVIVMLNCKERGQSVFYVVDIEAWCKEEEKGERKSITEQTLNQIGIRCTL